MNSKTAKNSDVLGSMERSRKLELWAHLVTISVFAIYFFVFMEWLFSITRHSFMEWMPFWDRLGILLVTGFLFVGLSLPFQLGLAAASLFSGPRCSGKVFLWAACLVPAAFIASTALLMFDNFTYTLFYFGIVTSTGLWRIFYGLLFLFLLIASFAWVLHRLAGQQARHKTLSAFKVSPTTFFILILLLASLLMGAHLYEPAPVPLEITPITGAHVSRPNILLIGSDAVTADHMSLYGYTRDTTPFLKSFAKSTLLAENNFPNASVTASSLVSMLSGKLPTQTRMLFPPDILRGADASQHLPGILKQEGYFTAQISVDYYADAYSSNLRDSFDTVNGRGASMDWLDRATLHLVPQDAAYFTSMVLQRIADRLFHIYYLRKMPDPYAQTTQVLNGWDDQKKLEQMESLFQNAQQPVFVQVHLMGTHENILAPLTDVFSKGESLNEETRKDFYDDSILTYDGYMRSLIQDLARMGKLENTMIIVYSDHGTGNVANMRLPLMIRFPNGEHAGLLSHNTQNLDIAPTILDYMGISQPAWMTGQSLLKGEPPVDRPIFSAAPNYRVMNNERLLELDLTQIRPPFYQFGKIGMIICQNWYALDTANLAWEQTEIQSYPTPCPEETLPNTYQAQQMLVDQMRKDGFDVSALRAAFRLPS